jgi:hypothetical protein
MAVTNVPAMAHIIKEQFGAGCSVRLRWHIIAFTVIALLRSAILSRSALTSAR